MSDDLEIIDVSSEPDRQPDGEEPHRLSGRREQPRALSRRARRARSRAAAGVVLTLGLLGVLTAAAYASWAIVSVRHIDRLVAEATAVDLGIRDAKSTGVGRLLPDETDIRPEVEAELEDARAELRGLAALVEGTFAPPDTRVSAYRAAAADAIRVAAGERDSAVLDDGAPVDRANDTPLADHPGMTSARAAVDARWPLLAPLIGTEAASEVLTAELRARLPSPDVLFDGDCDCRLRAVHYGSGLAAGLELDIRSVPHRARGTDLAGADTNDFPGPVGRTDLRFRIEGDTLVLSLRNGEDAAIPLGGGMPAVNEDAFIHQAWPEPEARGSIRIIDRDDGTTRFVDGAPRIVDVGAHHIALADESRNQVRTVDTRTYLETTWSPPDDLTFVSEAALSPDGTTLAMTGVGRRGWGLAIASQGRAGDWLTLDDEGYGPGVGSVRWTPDGRWVFWLQEQLPDGVSRALVFRWIRGARADGSEGPFTVRAAGRYRTINLIAG